MNNLIPGNSYLGKCSCGTEYLAPKGVLHCSKCLYSKIAELEKERESLLRLISYVKSIVFSKVKCSYASFKRPLEELLKDQGNG